MTRRQMGMAALGAALVIALVAFLVLRDDDSGDDPAASDQPSSSTGPPVVADDAWCDGWQNLVATQGAYVASPTPEASAALLATVEDLRALGVPESLDPAGYTELTAVLDDVRASVDPSFTPTVAPSEPADVSVEGDEHESEGEDHEDHGADAEEAPFGAWLAEYCAV